VDRRWSCHDCGSSGLNPILFFSMSQQGKSINLRGCLNGDQTVYKLESALSHFPMLENLE
jgi:hypothetical protein